MDTEVLMIDLYKLYVFDVVVQTSSFTTAADRLYITQSAVSHHIKDLESSLGQQLFLRGRRGVSLTSEGEILADYSRKIFTLVTQAENALTNVEQLAAGKVSIGATPGVGSYLIPEWVQQFRDRYPHLTVALQTGVTLHIIEEVLSHRLAIGIIEGELSGRPPANLAVQVLEEIEQMVVVGFRHPFWDRQQMKLGDLDQQSLIVRQQGSQSRAWIDEMLHAHGITPVIGAEFDNLESMKRAVTAGRCIAILPSYVVEGQLEQNQLRMIPITDKPLVRSLKLIWDSQTQFSPITRAFLTVLLNRYPVLRDVLFSPR